MAAGIVAVLGVRRKITREKERIQSTTQKSTANRSQSKRSKRRLTQKNNNNDGSSVEETTPTVAKETTALPTVKEWTTRGTVLPGPPPRSTSMQPPWSSTTSIVQVLPWLFSDRQHDHQRVPDKPHHARLWHPPEDPLLCVRATSPQLISLSQGFKF